MKKIALLFSFLLTAAVMAPAQNPFIKDQSNIYLKVPADKIGIGAAAALDKVTISSLSGETQLGLVGFPNHYNPFITCYNSNSVPIWKLYASSDWFTIGNTMDTTSALLVGRLAKGWFKVNGTGSFTRAVATTGAITTFEAHTATVTHLETTDTTGIVMYNSRGKYRIHISDSGSLIISLIPQ